MPSSLLTDAQAEASERLADFAGRLRSEISATLNQSVRRLRTFKSESQWGDALVESVASFCTRALLFTVSENTLRLQGVDLTPIPIGTVPAFAAVIESKDPIVAMRTRGELSAGLANYLKEVPGARCWLFPILKGDRVAAVLYADGEVDAGAVELLSNVAGAVLSGHQATPTPLPERKEHLEAQRMARVQVAEIVLYHSHALQSGRANRDLYQSLKPEIDARRQVFRRRFLENSPAMADYLHRELVKTLANDDAQLLGVDYPGPLA